jgi:hypothetical protein
MPQLPLNARQAHVFPLLHNSALISISQFCNSNFEARFTKHDVTILDTTHNVILQGERDSITGLWQIQLAPPASESNQIITTNARAQPRPQLRRHAAHNVYELQKLRDIIQYLHQAACSPVPSTWCQAIDAGFFTTWLILTAALVRKYLPKSLATATAKGHLRQEYQGKRSTQTPTKTTVPESPPEPKTRTNWVYMQPIEVTGKIFSNQTGRFPLTSSRGNKYIMIVYDYDSNAILAEPLKSRSENELLRAYTKIHDELSSRGLKPVLQILDNECPSKLKRFMKVNDVTYQLVPPHLHRRNAAERVISTWKDHFIAALSNTDPNSPLHLWCHLIEQATTTLNLLQPSRINPKLSAEAQLNGAFDFNKTPLAPPGTKVLVHEKSSKRLSWAAHGVEDCYLGRAPEHYRCYRVYITKTATERVADTVEFFPHHATMPKTSTADAARDAAAALTHALLNPSPATPFAQIGDRQMAALNTLSNIFSLIVQPAPAPLPRVALSKPAPLLPPLAAAPRVAAVASPRVTITTPQQVLPLRPPFLPQTPQTPHIVPPNEDDPASDHSTHRYPLRSQQQATIHRSANVMPMHFANSVTDPITGEVQEYRHLIKGPTKATWVNSFANELGRLAKGVGTRMPSGTETIFFIPKHKVPADRKVTYGRIVATIRPQKTEAH